MIKLFRKFAYPSYLLFIFLAFFFVKGTLSEESIKTSPKKNDKKTSLVKPVKVTLLIDNNISKLTYYEDMKNTDTVLELIENLRLNEKITFEVDQYTDRSEIVHINRKYADEVNKWQVYYQDENITYDIGDIELRDKSLYKLVFESTE